VLGKVGLVSTFNVECGIATYSEHLVEHFSSDSVIIFANYLGTLSDTGSCKKLPVIRCWGRKSKHDELYTEIIDSGVEVVHFQHEFGLFQDHNSFLDLLKKLKKAQKKVIITFHTVFTEESQNKKIYEYASVVDFIVVHHKNAVNSIPQVDNCVVIPHGSVKRKAVGRVEARKHFDIPLDRFVCLTFGFVTPTKGAADNINVVIELQKKYPNLMLIVAGFAVVHDNNVSNLEYAVNLFKQVKLVNKFDVVRILFKYLSEEEFDLLAGVSDIAVENYYQTQHSTSGMSHLVMSYGLPSISSRANILADLEDERSLKFDIGNKEQMSSQLERLMLDNRLRRKLSRSCLDYTKEVGWDKIARAHFDLLYY